MVVNADTTAKPPRGILRSNACPRCLNGFLQWDRVDEEYYCMMCGYRAYQTVAPEAKECSYSGCRRPLGDDASMYCEYHLEYARRSKYAQCAEDNGEMKCIKCHQVNDRHPKLYCSACSVLRAKQSKGLWNDRKAAGLCVQCGGPGRAGKVRCLGCSVKRSEQAMRRKYPRCSRTDANCQAPESQPPARVVPGHKQCSYCLEYHRLMTNVPRSLANPNYRAAYRRRWAIQTPGQAFANLLTTAGIEMPINRNGNAQE